MRYLLSALLGTVMLIASGQSQALTPIIECGTLTIHNQIPVDQAFPVASYVMYESDIVCSVKDSALLVTPGKSASIQVPIARVPNSPVGTAYTLFHFHNRNAVGIAGSFLVPGPGLLICKKGKAAKPICVYRKP